MDLDENIEKTLEKRLYSEVEGQCFGENGYVLAICQILSTSLGRVSDEDGSAHYRMKFNALVFKPFKFEVVDSVVKSIGRDGIRCVIGPFEFLVSASVCIVLVIYLRFY